MPILHRIPCWPATSGGRAADGQEALSGAHDEDAGSRDGTGDTRRDRRELRAGQARERLAATWRVLLVYALPAGPQRHAELRRRLSGISQKVLTETLRGMAAGGLVRRRVVRPTAPRHVECDLTELGRTLREPLAAICSWATDHPDGLPTAD
jgi:DNA-binding HxlR family transcriptional regulator